MLNKKQGIRLTHSKLGLPHWCFVSTLDQRRVQRLAEVKHYQKRSSPPVLGRKTRSSPGGCERHGLLRQAGDDTWAPGSNQPSLFRVTGLLKLFIFIHTFGKCFSNRQWYPFSFSFSFFSFFFFVGSESHFQAVAPKLYFYSKVSNIFRLHDCPLSWINLGESLNLMKAGFPHL